MSTSIARACSGDSDLKRGKAALAIAAVAGTLLGTQAAFAQDKGFYLGGALGQARLTEWCDTSSAGPGQSLSACEDTDTAWKVFGGYRFNRHVALEGTYLSWGKVSGTITSPGTTTNVSAEQTSMGVAAVGSFDFTPQFSVFGKAGFLLTEQDVRVGGNTVSGDETEFHYGLGLRFAFAPNWAARAEWEKSDELKAQMISVGVEFRF